MLACQLNPRQENSFFLIDGTDGFFTNDSFKKINFKMTAQHNHSARFAKVKGSEYLTLCRPVILQNIVGSRVGLGTIHIFIGTDTGM